MFSVNGAGRQDIRITPTDNALRYAFALDSVPRKEEDYSMTIQVRGADAGIDQQQDIDITVPARGAFRFLSAKRIAQPENGVEIVFSSPLDPAQDLKGLVEIKELPSAVCQIKGNKVYIYFNESCKKL